MLLTWFSIRGYIARAPFLNSILLSEYSVELISVEFISVEFIDEKE
jgi:hypothetical protein